MLTKERDLQKPRTQGEGGKGGVVQSKCVPGCLVLIRLTGGWEARTWSEDWVTGRRNSSDGWAVPRQAGRQAHANTLLQKLYSCNNKKQLDGGSCVRWRKIILHDQNDFFAHSTEKDSYFLFVGKAKLEKIYIFTTTGDKWVAPNITKNAINLQVI